MAVPPPLGNPNWQSIPAQSVYPGQTVRVNLRNYNSRNDASITTYGPSQQMQNPAWAQVVYTGNRLELVIAPPTSVAGGSSWTVVLRASALVGSQNVHRDITVTVNVQTPVRPALTPVTQNLTAGVAWTVDVNTFRTAGAPTPVYSLRGNYPDWVSLTGSTLSGTPPITQYTSLTNADEVDMRASNVGGDTDFTVSLQIARAVGPGITSIPAQYAVQGEAFSLDMASHIGGTPTPNILSTGLPTWMQVDGTRLTGTPVGYTQNTTETVTVTVQNVVGTVSHAFTLYVRVFSDTFTELTTGSPISPPLNNQTALAATSDRLYIATSNLTINNVVYSYSHTGASLSSETITLGSANGADANPVNGLAAHDGYLYVLGGTGSHYVFKYRISDRTLVGTQDVAGAASAICIPVVNGQHVLGVLRTTGTVQFWNIDMTSGALGTLDFTLQEDGVSASAWKAMAYDELDGKIYVSEENGANSFMYAFTPSGDRDEDEAIRLDSSNTQPRGAAYVDDTMYVGQGTAPGGNRWRGHVYIYTSAARVLDIPAQSAFDGEAWTLDLAPYLANDITVTFRTGYSVPAWLSLSNTVLSATQLPAVARSRQDDTYTILLTGTHADRTTDFEVTLTVKYIEAPTWTAIPTQTLDQRVTPNISNVNPPLKTSVTLDLDDYIANRSRAGALTFSVRDREQNNIGIQMNADGHTVTLTAPTTLSGVESFDRQGNYTLDLAVQNRIGSTSAVISVNVNHLILPSLRAIPNQDIHRNEVDTLDLSQFGTGLPTVFYALGTITPTLTEDVATIISNANGRWSIHPNPALERTGTYTVQVIATNRVGRASGSFNMTIHGVPRDTSVAPTWHTSGLTFDVNTGDSVTVDVSTLLAGASPQPTYSVSDASEVTNLGGTATLTGSELTVSIPSSVDSDTHASVSVSARNSAGGASVDLTFNVHYVSAPVWTRIPAQTWHVGEASRLDLNAYVTSIPAVTNIRFQPGETPPSWMTLVSGVLSGTPDDEDYTTATTLSLHCEAVNPIGTTPVQIFLNISIAEVPAWTTDAIRLVIIEGQTETYPLADYMSAATPIPVYSFGAGILQLPITAHLQGDALTITAPGDIAVATEYTLPLIATNSEGVANKDVTLVVDPRIALGELTHFVSDDYNEIRSLLDLRLTEAELPNAVIASSIYQNAAFSWVAIETADVVSPLSEDETLQYKKRAALYRCAGLIAPAVSKRISESVGSVSERYTFVDWLQTQRGLFARADEALSHLKPVNIEPIGYFGVG